MIALPAQATFPADLGMRRAWASPPMTCPICSSASIAAACPGSGLGLATVRTIAAAHGGAVAVDITPGEGSRFRLALPLA